VSFNIKYCINNSLEAIRKDFVNNQLQLSLWHPIVQYSKIAAAADIEDANQTEITVHDFCQLSANSLASRFLVSIIVLLQWAPCGRAP